MSGDSKAIAVNQASAGLDLIEAGKKRASVSAVDEFIVKDPSVRYIGIGSGSTVVYVIEYLKELKTTLETRIKDMIFVPTSFQSKILLIKYKLRVGTLEEYPKLDVTIDGADEVDSSLNAIKGGGGCQLQEKIVAFAARKFIIVADYRKNSKILGEQWLQGIPIEVVPMAYTVVSDKITLLGGKPTLRMAVKNKAGPVVTDNGNLIIDADFGLITSPRDLEVNLKMIPGVVEVGLFTNLISKAFFGMPDGTVRVVAKNNAV